MPSETAIHKILKYFAVASFFGYVGVLFYMPIEIEDVWWHLSTGRWIMNHFSVPLADPFSFSSIKVSCTPSSIIFPST